jgi:hypothetical protein
MFPQGNVTEKMTCPSKDPSSGSATALATAQHWGGFWG